MTKRQLSLLDYHLDVARLTTSQANPVFVILDLDDTEGFKIASEFTENCAEKRDAIKASGSIPAYTLACALGAANALLAHGWPGAKRLGNIPPDKFPIMLVSDGRCLTVLVDKQP
jgi:hypothetical protein